MTLFVLGPHAMPHVRAIGRFGPGLLLEAPRFRPSDAVAKGQLLALGQPPPSSTASSSMDNRALLNFRQSIGPIRRSSRSVKSHAAGFTYAEISRQLGVGEASVSRVLRLKREKQSVAPLPRGGGNFAPIQREVADFFVQLVKQMPDATIDELTEAPVEANVEISRSSVVRRSRGSVLSKKETITCDASTSGASAASAFPADDGSGASWKTLSIVDAIRLGERPRMMPHRGAVNGRVFRTFVRTRLVPFIEAGDIVIMDSLNIHKMIRVRQLMEAAGATPIYLPTYSPELSPIELW